MNTKSKMLNKWMLGAALSVTTLFSNASVITDYETAITGADMTGLKVTLNTSGGTETLDWAMLTNTLNPVTGGGLTPTQENIVASEGLSGGVSGSDWSLVQQGFTGGDFDLPNIYGLWTFVYSGSDILESLVLDAFGTDLVFDTQLTSAFAPNNSGVGREFVAFEAALNGISTDVSATYLDQVASDELYRKVSIDFNQQAPEFSFLIDVDKAVNVSEPSMLLVFLSGLALVVRRKYNAK
ncbi:hypothetical protein KO525_08075 [Psychrosphaera sp. B3R10]|uniref:hypothetical protein n=1 Tax=unclassified Psychrosphaera TaxID=2641570 RepID=UPI001C09C704|nr:MULTISPECIES: hypothetical protein [unclassified Psychrosphaera]MBU2882653.1 hypothetical protein [Psychrosphaera sp. I2R16]MBU2989328.1 hypothetical protein [Psychrosphaera sp. B3R10]